MVEELRGVIRELLAEELAKVRAEIGGKPAAPGVHEEAVTIASDQDLETFVKRLMALASDPKARGEIEAGRHRFRLSGNTQAAESAAARTAPSQAGGATPHFDRGVVTERDVGKLPPGLTTVRVSKRVRFTPLAKDELRRRGVTIERTSS